MNEANINAKFQALIQQRDIAQAGYVNLSGEYAQLLEEVTELRKKVEHLSAFEGAEVIEADEVKNG